MNKYLSSSSPFRFALNRAYTRPPVTLEVRWESDNLSLCAETKVTRREEKFPYFFRLLNSQNTDHDYVGRNVFSKERFNAPVTELFYLKYETVTIVLSSLLLEEQCSTKEVQIHSNFNKRNIWYSTKIHHNVSFFYEFYRITGLRGWKLCRKKDIKLRDNKYIFVACCYVLDQVV